MSNFCSSSSSVGTFYLYLRCIVSVFVYAVGYVLVLVFDIFVRSLFVTFTLVFGLGFFISKFVIGSHHPRQVSIRVKRI